MTDEWIRKCIYITFPSVSKHRGILFSLKKKKKKAILPFSTTWMDLEGIMLSEMKSDRERQILHDFSARRNLK